MVFHIHKLFISIPGKNANVLTRIFELEVDWSISPPIIVKFLKKYFKSESHYEAASNDHKEHVEEEVPVVVVTNTII